MGKLNLSKIAKNFQKSTAKYSPDILIAIGIVGMVTTTVMAVKATPKAIRLMEEEKERQNAELLEEAIEDGNNVCNQINKLNAIDTIKVTWKCYAPAAVMCLLSAGCILSGNKVNKKRNAALATAYALTESAFNEYKSKVVETIGEKKEQTIRDSIAKDKIVENPVSKCEIYETGHGKTLCYDAMSGRYFRSDIEHIKKVVNKLNKRMLSEMYISLNDFYYEIGLRCTDRGDEVGWNINNEGFIELNPSSCLNEDDEPVWVLGYYVGPRYDYTKLY